MKKVFRFLPVLAILMAISSAFAFQQKTKAPQPKRDIFYYVYSGTTTDLSDYEQSSNWSTSFTADPGGCNGGSTLPCVITSSFSDKADLLNDINTNGAGVVDNNVADYKH